MTQASFTSSMAQGATPVVACQGLVKVFKDFWRRDRARAVDHVSFEIRPREVFGLLGPNGSGKSTTIKIILGLLKPTSGRIAVLGKSPTDVEVKRRIGYLPEESYLYPFLNARETLEYYAKLFELDYRTREKRIDELLDMVGLAGAQHRPVREYSKGMQRRIGLAQALINDPDFLILDEPTTGLDPIGTRQVKDLILMLGRRGKTVLLSSHLLADVEDCVDRMIILYGGKIRASGTCDELLEHQSLTTIEADAIDDDTISEIDQLIRRRSGGHKTVHRVSRPRQKLEELFVGLVQKANQERVQTSGAQQGGQTASFLTGPAEAGREVVERLVRAGSIADLSLESGGMPPPKIELPRGPGTLGRGDDPSARKPEAHADVQSEALIASLLNPEAPPVPVKPSPATPMKPIETSEVNRSLIDSLLDGGGGGGGDRAERGR
jgi:ABC-2 type transport system ATP-binding protein